MIFVNTWASTLKVWKVFSLENDFLFEFILTDCVIYFPEEKKRALQPEECVSSLSSLTDKHSSH